MFKTYFRYEENPSFNAKNGKIQVLAILVQ